MAATVSVSGSTVTYDAAPHGATATTNPAGLAVTVTYNGSATPPTNAGTYTVVATITASGYTGTASSTLVINKATPRITWSSPAAVEEGTALSGAQLNAAGSIPGTLSYSPSAGFVPSVGSNALSVTFTPADSANWNNASASVSLTVNAKAVTGGGGGEPTPEPTPAPTVKNLVLGFSMSSSKISKADLVKIANASLDNPDSVITIVGYAQPSGNKAADLKLSRARANAVKAQILALNPDANITIIAKGSAINKTCKKTLNKCAIVSVA
jgi:outer membrane protein OmpA-like peptidoglycan-associated protein